MEVQQVSSWYVSLSRSVTGQARLSRDGSVSDRVGSGEFLLVKQGSEEVKMVVRTINSSAFSKHDWEEYIVTVSLG